MKNKTFIQESLYYFRILIICCLFHIFWVWLYPITGLFGYVFTPVFLAFLELLFWGKLIMTIDDNYKRRQLDTKRQVKFWISIAWPVLLVVGVLLYECIVGEEFLNMSHALFGTVWIVSDASQFHLWRVIVAKPMAKENQD